MPIRRVPAHRRKRQSSRRPPDARMLIAECNGVMVSVAGVYITTDSTFVTVAAAVVAVTLAGWLAFTSR